MQVLNHCYQDDIALLEFLSNPLFVNKNVLLQCFNGVMDGAIALDIVTFVKGRLDNVTIIGSSTSGEILEGSVVDDKIILSFSIFDQTDLFSFYSSDLDFESGQKWAQKGLELGASCVILFADTLLGQPQYFLDGFSKAAPEMIVAGGNAGDNNRFEQSFLINDTQVYNSGIVGCFLVNADLTVHQDHFLSWTPLGPEMMVTSCDKDVIYELDDKPVIEVYKYFLGDEIVHNLLSSIMGFPLMVYRNGMAIGRSTVALTEDLGVVYAGTFEKGDKVQFGIGDLNTIFDETSNKMESFVDKVPVEAVFIYSCTARRSFLKENVEPEVLALSQLAPTSGFFTYGEFYHHKDCDQLLNITTTFLLLSESSDVKSMDVKKCNAKFENISTLRSLTRLAAITSKELEESISSLEQYKDALDETAMVSKADSFGNITYVNKKFEEVSGYCFAEVKGRNHNILRHPDMPSEVYKDLWGTIKSKKIWKGTIKNRKKDGSSYFVKSVIIPLMGENDEIIEFISIRKDVTELIRQKNEIKQDKIDQLTGLPNRKQLLLDLSEMEKTAIALLDVKGFKLINNFYGFDLADLVLVQLAKYVQSLCDDYGFRLYCIGADKFAINPSKQMSLEAFKEDLYSISRRISQHEFIVENVLLDIDVMIGIGCGERYQLQLAESALGVAKQNASLLEIPIEKEASSNVLEHIVCLQNLRAALNENRVINYYQPIVNPDNENEKKYEALVRMIDSQGNIVGPAQFLDVAKKSRYYFEITLIVLKNAMEFVDRSGATVSVNLSIKDIEYAPIRKQILSFLNDQQAGKIILEITESESIQDPMMVNNFIQAAKNLGAEVAIDDFGSGYSNFSYLAEMDVDYLKIDGSIISKILEDQNSLFIAESIIDIAKKLGIKVIAEFVSNEAIFEKLKEYSVDYYQGYYFSEPKPLEAFEMTSEL